MDYNSLKLQIQNFVNRSDQFFIDQIPDFINQGINRIYSRAKGIGFQKNQTDLTFVVGQPLIRKPMDLKRIVSLSYVIPGGQPVRVYVLPRSYEFCKTYSPLEESRGDPVCYADYSMALTNVRPGFIYLSPTPAMAYSYELVYFSLPLFNSQNPTNFLTDRYPSLLLYACLEEAIPFLKDDERIATIEAFYNRSLQDALGDNIESYTDRLSKRDN